MRVILSLPWAFILAVAVPALAQPQPRLPVLTLHAGMHLIKAEVADEEAERQQGLMYRERLGVNEGMVFVFDNPAPVCMWMKNTYIPLSVAFLDPAGKIINIEDMAPQTTSPHCARKPATYALEMTRGWFQQKNIRPGTTIEGLPRKSNERAPGR